MTDFFIRGGNLDSSTEERLCEDKGRETVNYNQGDRPQKKPTLLTHLDLGLPSSGIVKK